MGWDGTYIGRGRLSTEDKKNIIRERFDAVPLKDTFVGNTYYGIYESEDGVRDCIIALTKIEDGEMLVKVMSENDCPNACAMPISYLNLLPPTKNKFAIQWRANVRDFAMQKSQTKASSKIPLNQRRYDYSEDNGKTTVSLDYHGLTSKIGKPFGRGIEQLSRQKVGSTLVADGRKSFTRTYSPKGAKPKRARKSKSKKSGLFKFLKR